MMSKGNYSLSKNQRRGNIVSYAVLIIGALLVILPILWMFITALKDDLEIYQMNGRILPEAITATSFIRIWKDYDFVLYFRNSLGVTLVAVLISLVASTLTGYGATRFNLFHNADVDTVFDVSRSIYEKDFQKINTVYKEKAIPAELGVVIGAITESQRLINHALQSEKKGGQIYMCGALEELVNEGVQRGRQEGRIEGLQEGILKGQLEGIHANIRTCKTFKISKSDTIKNVAKEFSLSEDEARDYVEKYW